MIEKVCQNTENKKTNGSNYATEINQFDKIINRKNTRALKVDILKELYGTEDVIPLWVADMDFALSPAIIEAIRTRTEHPLFGYSVRPNEFKEAIVNWLKRRYFLDIMPSWIEFSPGVVPNLAYAIESLTSLEEKVVIQPPVYPPFFSVPKDCNRSFIENPLIRTETGYIMDYEHFDKITKTQDVKLFILCNPHNPVGRSWKKNELEEIGKICLKNNILVISDEIHSDLTFFENKHTPFAFVLPELQDITLTCMAPSKSFNLAGFATSYYYTSNSQLLAKVKKQVQKYHADLGNTFGSIVLEAAYNQSEEWLDELKKYLEGNIVLVYNFITQNLPEIKMNMPEATYLIWLDFNAFSMSDEELKRFLIKEAKLGLNDGAAFGKQGLRFQRMNIASPRSIIQKAMDQLFEAYKKII